MFSYSSNNILYTSLFHVAISMKVLNFPLLFLLNNVRNAVLGYGTEYHLNFK